MTTLTTPGPVERACGAFLSSLSPLEPSYDDVILLRLAFYGGVAEALRMLADAEQAGALAPRSQTRLAFEVMVLIERLERLAGVRP